MSLLSNVAFKAAPKKSALKAATALPVLFLLSSMAQAAAFEANSLEADLSQAEDEIIITASPLEQQADDTLVGVSVLTGEDLARRLSGTLGETLKYQPGLSSTQFGAGASRPIIRGQGGDRIRVLDNGIGSIDASAASPDHAVSVEPAMATRIEVVRGSGLLRYGSSGSGGVVNVIDARLPDQMPEGGIDGAVRLGSGSVDSSYEAAGGVSFGIGEGTEGIVLHLSGSQREAEDYDIPGFAEVDFVRAEEPDEEHARDTLENSFAESQSVAGGISFIGERGFIALSLKNTQSLYGIPSGHGHEEEEGEEHDEEEEAHEDEEEETISIDLKQDRFDIKAGLTLDGFFEALNFYGGIADYEHVELEGDEIGTTFTNEGGEARVELIQTKRDNWQAAYGIQYRQRDFSAIGEEAFVPPTSTEQFGLYTFHEWENDDLHLEGALRFEETQHDVSTSGEEASFSAFSASVGADFHLAENTRLGGTIFQTTRAPTTEELFSNGPHLATSQFELGDATLSEERARGGELVFRHDVERGYLTLNLFYTDYEDYIFERETGAEEDELPVFQFTAADAVFQGLEAEAEIMLGAVGTFDVKANGVLDLVNAELSNGDNLPRIPPLSALVGITADNTVFSLTAELDYAAEQDDLSPIETPTDSYLLTNFHASYKVPTFEGLSANISLLNAFDEEARQHTSFLKDEVPLPGRNVKLSLSFAF